MFSIFKIKNRRRIFLVIPLIITAFSVCSASSDSLPERKYIFFPKEVPAWKLIKTLGLTVAYLPKAVVEEELNQSPLIDVNLRLGLPYNFCANGRISTIYLTNHLLIGLQWCHSIGGLSFSLGYDFAYWVGRFKTKAFNVLANGTMNYPYFSFGYDFKDFYVSLKTEALIVTFDETFAGNVTVGGIRRDHVGWAITYGLEQPLWKDVHIVQGVKLNITKFFYQSWIAFAKFDRYIIFPEFIIGFQL